MKRALFVILPLVGALLASLGIAANYSFGPKNLHASYFFGGSIALLLFWIYCFWGKVLGFFRRNNAKNSISSLLSHVLIVCIVFGAGLFFNKPSMNLRFDATENKTNTLSSQSLKIIDKIRNGGLHLDVLGFFTSDQKKNQFLNLLSIYQSEGLSCDVRTVDPDQEPALSAKENITLSNTVVFKSGELVTRITSFSEESLTKALLRLLTPKTKHLFFIKGHGELSLADESGDGLSILASDLENYSYSLKTASLLELDEVSMSPDLVIIAGPKYDLMPAELKILQRFVSEGSGLMVFIDAMVAVPNLNQFLSGFGMRFNNDLLLLDPDDPRISLLGQDIAIISEFDEFNAITRDFAQRSGTSLIFPASRSIGLHPKGSLKTKILAKTSGSIFGLDHITSRKDLGEAGEKTFKHGPFGVLGLITGEGPKVKIALNDGNDKGKGHVKDFFSKTEQRRKEKTRILLSGSSGFITNQGVQRAENFDMAMNMVNFMLQDEDVIGIRPRKHSIGTLYLVDHASHFVLLTISYIYPFLFLGFGVFLWAKRRAA